MSQPLEELAGRARPVTLAGQRLLPVLAPLAELLHGEGLRRGSTLTVSSTSPCGATSLALALAAAPSQTGSWVAAVGSWAAELGLVAAAELGVCLERFALVPDPGSQWQTVVATVLDSMDVVLVGGCGRVRLGEARRLAARARERGAVLVVLGSAWPERADVGLVVSEPVWRGLGQGYGSLRARRVDVRVAGRGAASRPRRVELWLPGEGGDVARVAPVGAVAPVGVEQVRATAVAAGALAG